MTLIERLEALSGPDREVDVEIALAVEWSHPAQGCTLAKLATVMPVAEIAHEAREHSNSILSQLPRYSASIDAAMTLVPEGWGRMFNQSENGLHCNVCLARSYPTNAVVYSEAATPAIALCIASLRARSADNG